MIRRLRRRLCVLVGVGFLLTCAPVPTFAEGPGGAAEKREKRRKKRKKRPRERERATDQAAPAATPAPAGEPRKREVQAKEERGPGRAAASPQDAARAAAQDAAQGVNAEIVKEGETSVKVMRFGGLDIEGRLKSPQLLYFVNRVRAEFERPKLPHRTFIPELQRSTHREPLK